MADESSSRAARRAERNRRYNARIDATANALYWRRRQAERQAEYAARVAAIDSRPGRQRGTECAGGRACRFSLWRWSETASLLERGGIRL
jgi:hypothetical protein